MSRLSGEVKIIERKWSGIGDSTTRFDDNAGDRGEARIDSIECVVATSERVSSRESPIMRFKSKC